VKIEKNEDFFDNWSQDMAYVLGFTMADSCVYSNEYRFGYGINIKDRKILEYISKLLLNNINHIKDVIEYRKDTPCHISRLRICSKKIVNKLYSYNIFPRKTGLEKLPLIPDKYKADYLRGLFDGDGSIHYANKTQQVFQIVSASQSFLLDVKKELGFNFGYIHNKSTCWSWYVYKQKEIKKIKDFIYYLGHNFSLERKRIKFK